MDSTQMVCQVSVHFFHSCKCSSVREQDNEGNLMGPRTPESPRGRGVNSDAAASSLCVASGERIVLGSGYTGPRTAAASSILARPLAVFALVLVSAGLCCLWTQPGGCPDLLQPPDIALTWWCCFLLLSSPELMLVHLLSHRELPEPSWTLHLLLHLESSPLSCQFASRKIMCNPLSPQPCFWSS